MNDIDWIMQKNIGFFYITQEWKNKIFNYILSNTYMDDVIWVRNNKNEACINFVNGDRITFIPADLSAARGRKFTQIGYEKDISDETINCIIAPAIMPLCIEIGIDE